MRILGIESASLTASVAIVTDDQLTAEYTINYKKTHSQTLLPMIQEIMSMTETDLKTIDAIAVSAGPGSFTGLRIGSATAKGLALALNLPIVSVPTVDAMAYQCWRADCLICPIMDARRNQVYTGIYEFCQGTFHICMEQTAIEIDYLMSRLNGMGRAVLFLGDGVPVYRERIGQMASVEVEFAPSFLSRQRAGAVAALGMEYFKKGICEDAAIHTPIYLRPSSAERELAEKNLKKTESSLYTEQKISLPEKGDMSEREKRRLS